MERKDEWQLVGSRYFFDGIEGFKPSDSDFVLLEDNPENYKYSYQLSGKGSCHFKWKWMNPDEFIEYMKKDGVPMQIGKFLVPEFNKKIGFTYEHLLKISELFDNIDKKHKYEKIICDSYIENGDFTLTDEQRMKAYEEYKKEREK